MLFSEILRKKKPDLSVGDRVAFLTPHNVVYILCQWAVWLNGCINVPLCPQHPPSEIEYFLQNSQPSLVISTPEHSQVSAWFIFSKKTFRSSAHIRKFFFSHFYKLLLVCILSISFGILRKTFLVILPKKAR